MVEILRDYPYFDEDDEDDENDEDDEDDEDDMPKCSLFVNGERVLSFEGKSVRYVLLSSTTLLETGDRINLGSASLHEWGFKENFWLERQGTMLVALRGNYTHTFTNDVLDDRIVLTEIPFDVWTNAITQFATLINSQKR